MFIRIGACVLVLVIVLWSWKSQFGADLAENREQSIPERRRSSGDVGEVKGFSLGLVRRKNLLETRRYRVPFFAWLGDSRYADGGGISIPISPPPPVTPDLAVEVLRRRGIEFRDQASASYDNESSLLVVTNHPTQLDLVEQFVASLQKVGPRTQVQISVTTVDITNENLEDLGFEWLQDGILDQVEGPIAPQADMDLKIDFESEESEGLLNMGSGTRET